MTPQTSYPVFENGQVLTSSQLNDLAEYLEQQDRATRSKLIGIGVACGFEVDYQPENNVIRITGGVAVTSEGYLLYEPECSLTKFRDYTLPVPEFEEAPDGAEDVASYDFFIDSDGNQIPLWELLPDDFEPAPGENDPTGIGPSFVADKVVLLFLECDLRDLKNCDVNDCSDKGSKMQFTIRKLLVTKADAQAMLDTEAGLAGRPVDAHNHPKYDVDELRIQKINPSANDVATYSQLLERVVVIAEALSHDLLPALQKGYDAYSYLLKDVYPESSFPNGPFGDPTYFAGVNLDLASNLFMAQYYYDYLYDVVQSHNEFVRVAGRFEAECCPDERRFPKHVLLGEVEPLPAAFASPFGPSGDGSPVDPLSADSGFGPQTRPAAYRHHWIPSQAHPGQNRMWHQVRSLHYRTYQLAFRYSASKTVGSEIRLTPSKDGDYVLSDKSIPFYYHFEEGDDLHRNWSFGRTTANRLDHVHSYALLDDADHPLLYKHDDENFYRVEGIVGRGLGDVMRTLVDEKKRLGVSFGIEPVYLGLTLQDQVLGDKIDKEARERAEQVLTRILSCRMSDIDAVFLAMMATIFFFLLVMIALIARASTLAFRTLSASDGDQPTPAGGGGGGLTRPGRGALNSKIGRVPVSIGLERTESDEILSKLRPGIYKKGVVAEHMAKSAPVEDALGIKYQKVKEGDPGSSLYDRTVKLIKEEDPEADAEAVAQQIYPAINLLDRSEDLVSTVSASSLSEFNFQEFQYKYDGLSQAYEAYAENSAKQAQRNESLKETDAQLEANYTALAGNGPLTLVGNMMKEVNKRIKNLFEDLILGTYAKRHPGMEHKAGVASGGTLVLAYTHREFVRTLLSEFFDQIKEVLEKNFSQYLGSDVNLEVVDPAQLLASAPSSDPLDEFVVLADFCLPTMCCDADCSDIELERDQIERPIVEKLPDTGRPVEPVRPKADVVVNGRVLDPSGQMIAGAGVSVIHVESGKSVEVKVRRGAFAFTGPAAKYRVSANAEGFKPRNTTLNLESESGRVNRDITLDVIG